MCHANTWIRSNCGSLGPRKQFQIQKLRDYYVFLNPSNLPGSLPSRTKANHQAPLARGVLVTLITSILLTILSALGTARTLIRFPGHPTLTHSLFKSTIHLSISMKIAKDSLTACPMTPYSPGQQMTTR